MADCLDNITGSRFSLGTDHGRALRDTSERLAQIFCSADKRYFKFMFVDVIYIICRGKHFTLIDVIDLDRL